MNYPLDIWKLTDTEITIVLPGGRLGEYKVQLEKEDFGYNSVATEGNDLMTYSLTVTGMSHHSGSLFGGLTLTIDGTHFSENLNENNVVLSVFNNWNLTCHVRSATET